MAALGAAAAAGFAGNLCRDFDLGAAALIGLFQRDLEIVAQILAAIAPLALAAAAHQIAEEILEHVAEGAGEVERVAAGGAASHAAFKGGMAETVIGGALLIVFEDIIGFADFLEFDFGGRITRIFVRMEF